ncbi:MAG: TetR/AcrR family transcriptional regulator [Myxococcales bacterium]|jgi:AcrR family transcriptional regulator|nr:TetR/AcrR family transcriptional regulator [Myxococcales bacterium]
MATRKRKGASGVQLGEDVARSMIIAGGARVFAARGIRDTSVEDLLEASKVSRRTFYRLFSSKDDVALALYKFGTGALVENWKRALASSSDPIEQFAKCIDVHLNNAAMLGRLIFVLGGEATRQESPLHEHRMKIHDRLVELLQVASPQMAKIDPLLVRTTLFALEAITRQVLTEGDEGRKVSPAAIERARRVMVRVVSASFAGSGKGVTELPLADD